MVKLGDVVRVDMSASRLQPRPMRDENNRIGIVRKIGTYPGCPKIAAARVDDSVSGDLMKMDFTWSAWVRVEYLVPAGGAVANALARATRTEGGEG